MRRGLAERMRLVRGGVDDPEADLEVTATLLDRAGETALRVWRPTRRVAFGRRDAASDSYERARATAEECGYRPVKRDVGGRAVAHTGETVAFSYVVATDAPRGGIRARYRGVTGLLKRALRSVGATAYRGEPEASFCPGAHSLQSGGKLAGIAQRVTDDAALVAGCVVVRERDGAAIAAVLDPVYRALEIPFDPDSVGSVEDAGGPGDSAAVVDAIESAFVGDRDPSVVDTADLLGEVT